jgi:hypothetical protein
MTFVEVPAVAAPMDAEALEVVLASSARVRVRPNFDDVTLRRLLAVLDGR